ncbi:bifunctional diguanylate cyclase/phosphodiesterase [Albimonas sp. CAU 1670]|uniref:putative bifunctional diguanylate cyclase/phosphodiesterase n=1 Tax=Albimonas sp. CAU 1670 TaxID=3032599 RepID=UPI0023D9B35F|nr:bifunctional diguanylate cyclase/phosphodiesterase [Albimonas sp. CAU 1670]MDF2232230.1 bifunctional diguanylate cyclase/phosphodiesterase [Albimonas sp. CAU 1670]
MGANPPADVHPFPLDPPSPQAASRPPAGSPPPLPAAFAPPEDVAAGLSLSEAARGDATSLPLDPGLAALRRRASLAPLLVVAGALLLVTGVGAAMAWSTAQTVRFHALRLVESWAVSVTEASPTLPLHLRAGRLPAADLDPLRQVGARADAFGFRLFDPDGAPVATAWRWRGYADGRLEAAGPGLEPTRETAADLAAGLLPPSALAQGASAVRAALLPVETQPLPRLAPEVWRRLRAGEKVVEIEEAQALALPDGPARVAEVFLPLHDHRGALAGYAEVYIDVDGFAARVGRVQALAGAALAVAGALTFAGPALAWLGARRRREQAEARVRHAAYVDALTGLPNRAGFACAAARLARDAGRDGARLAVLAIDLDRFRATNDLHGPEVGDALLKVSAGMLRAGLRGEDLVARVGPDDFAALLRLTAADDLPAILARLAARVAQPIADDGGRPLALSASIGACLLPPGDLGVDGALRRAEIAQREARAAGPGRTRLFEPEMEHRVLRRRAVETAIREGVAHGRFSLSYQPLVSARDGATRGFEALMRLRDGDGAPVSPAEFIPAAEDMDQIGALGAWALHEATTVAAAWPAPLSVSVNLSVAQFRDGRLVETVRSALAASGLAPARLELEVTESLLISDIEAVERQLAQLRALGVSISMDDFGAGYSSLAYLWRFRFNRLKLDRSFLLAFDANPARARGMIGGIVALGRRMGMKVTAEGIETPAQAAAMAELGCDTLQGFHFGRPMPEAELREVMRWEADAADEAAALARAPLSAFADAAAAAVAGARPEGIDRRSRRAAEPAPPPLNAVRA